MSASKQPSATVSRTGRFGYAQGIVDPAAFFDMLATTIHKTPVVHRMYIELDGTKSERTAMRNPLLKLDF